MSYLVLGSNSFAGSRLVKHLLDLDEKVIGVSRSPEPSTVLLAYANHKNISNFKFYQFDINKHFTELKALISKAKPNYIVDLAGQGMVAESWVKPEQWYQTNIVAKVKLHDFLRSCDFLEKYLRVSTPEVYGSTSGCVKEDHAFAPSTPYAVSHAATDMSLMAFYRQYDFPMVITRFANFYGAHQQLYRIVPRTIIYNLVGKKLQLHGGGLSTRAFINGDDVATGIVAAITKGKNGEAYHFSAGKAVSIANLVRSICNGLGCNFDDFVELAKDRPGKDAAYFMDTTKAQTELGWQPSVDLQFGINRTIAWVQDNLTKIQELPLEYLHKA